MSWKPSARLILCLMAFWGQIQNYMMRVNLSILIVEMVKTNKTENVSTIEDLTCPENRNQNETFIKNPDHNQGFEWDEHARGRVLGAFAVGYVLTNVSIFLKPKPTKNAFFS